MLESSVREKILHVITLLEQGPRNTRIMTLTEACDTAGITYASFKYHVEKDTELKDMFRTALAISEDIAADMLINIDRYVGDPKMATVISKNTQWVLSRRRRQDYGDHVTVEHTTTRDQQLLARMAEVRQRALLGDIVEGEVIPSSGAPAPCDSQDAVPVLPDPTREPDPEPDLLQALLGAS